ncbi:MAG: TraR/DksA C4-type zinc finger protein [Terrimicrobiaceae bacterium]
MANNPQKPPKAKVFETVAKQAKAAPKAAKLKTVTKNTEETNEAPLEESPPIADKPSIRVQGPSSTAAKRGPLSPFEQRQREKLLALKDTLLDSMNGVAKDSLRSRAEGSEASAFGMHQADAGSDAYDRDFALSLLSQEQDSLYEIDEALKRIENGNYGVCEMSGKAIPHARLEALPFTRYTVECQAELEKRNRFQRVRQPVISLFGLSDEEGAEEDEDNSADTKD